MEESALNITKLTNSDPFVSDPCTNSANFYSRCQEKTGSGSSQCQHQSNINAGSTLVNINSLLESVPNSQKNTIDICPGYDICQ